MSETERFVDAAEAAAFLGISRKHLLKLSRLALIPAHPLQGFTSRKTWRYLLSELRVWMLNNGTLPNNGPSRDDGRTISSGSSRKGGQ
jgi:hypothetical protein